MSVADWADGLQERIAAVEAAAAALQAHAAAMPPVAPDDRAGIEAALAWRRRLGRMGLPDTPAAGRYEYAAESTFWPAKEAIRDAAEAVEAMLHRIDGVFAAAAAAGCPLFIQANAFPVQRPGDVTALAPGHPLRQLVRFPDWLISPRRLELDGSAAWQLAAEVRRRTEEALAPLIDQHNAEEQRRERRNQQYDRIDAAKAMRSPEDRVAALENEIVRLRGGRP